MNVATAEPVALTPRPIPRLMGHSIFGPLASFRKDRVGTLLRFAESHPEMVEMPMGVVRHFIVTSSPALANEVLATKQASFRKSPGLAVFLRPLLGDGLLTTEKETHAQQRKLLAPVFAHKRIAAFGETMAARAARFVTALRDGEPVELADAMMRLTFEIVGKTLFDAEVIGDAKVVGDALTTAMQVALDQLSSPLPIPPQVPTPKNLRYRRAVARLDAIVYRLIRERRAEGVDRGDVLSMLIDAKHEDGTPMPDRQIRDEAMTLFLAGHETTANALTWTFYLLGRHPEVRARMEAELDALGERDQLSLDDLKRLPYTLAVFKESMRLYPPAYIVGRRALTDVAIGPHVVKKGAIVIVNILGIHRRPDLWPDPERFDPERFLGDREKELPRCAFMPFGAGPRICIGNHFALMEGHILLATLARRVRFELGDAPAAFDPLVTLRPRDGLQATVRARAALT